VIDMTRNDVETARTVTLSAFAPGKILGRYELLAPIARGGMAEVWAARLLGSRGFQRVVAVKTIVSGIMDDAANEQMLLQEASLASRIQHPNVAATLDLGEQDGVLFLVMEWVDGEPLTVLFEQTRRSGPIPLPIAINLIGQACRGLQAAHELRDDDGAPLGIVHRDVSPHNVLVTHTGTVKLVDFGIAKATHAVTGATETGAVKGKLAYMAPEQVRGEAIDRRADVFAMGILLYLLTTGQHPHKGATLAETIHRLLSETPKRPSELVEAYPPLLEPIVLKALNKEADCRFADARELFEALAQAVPEAFQPGFESEVASFLEQVVGDRGAESKARLRVAQQALDAAGKESTAVSAEPDLASIASLRALVVEAGEPTAQARSAGKTHTTLASQGLDELRPRRYTRDPGRFKLLLSAIAVLALVGSLAVRSSLRNGSESAAQAPAPAATVAEARKPALAPMMSVPSARPPSAVPAASVVEASNEKSANKVRRTVPRSRVHALARPPPVATAARPSATTIAPSATRDPLANRY
jgi:tRNA A-37 threonylcarbamoyl transferase component Bud32